MEVIVGYKKANVGVIPEDWEVKPIGELFSVSGGFSSSRDQLSDDGYCYLHYGDIHKSNKTYIDVEEEYPEIPKLKIDIKSISQKSILNNGDVVFVDASEDDEGASKHVVIRNPRGIPYISGLHTIVIKSNDDSVVNLYKQFCFQTSNVKKQFKFYAVGTKVTGISKTNIANIQIALPPTKAEQNAIAASLSDADALINSLEKLITKKRNIKQGAIQLLLTGKKRLPRFSGEWKERILKEIVSQFIVPMRDKPKVFKGNIPWCRIEDFDGKYLSDSKSNQYVDQEIINSMNLKIHPKETLLVSCSADLGRCAIVKAPLISNQTFIGLVFDEHVAYNEFFYYYMTFHSEELNKLSSGTTISYLSREQFEDFKVIIPPIKEEQTAIAQVLSEMDSEIEALERKLGKYRLIKQGMMQELLTGKKRLL